MEKRPLSLTIIGWWLVISAVFGIDGALTVESNAVAMAMLAKSGTSITLHRSMSVVNAGIAGLCGYGVLKGQPWSRVLYVADGVIGLGVLVLIMPIISMLVLGVIFLIVIAYFLFRPAADRWFAAKGFQVKRGVA